MTVLAAIWEDRSTLEGFQLSYACSGAWRWSRSEWASLYEQLVPPLYTGAMPSPPEVGNQRGCSIPLQGPVPLQGLGHGWLLKMQLEGGEWDRLARGRCSAGLGKSPGMFYRDERSQRVWHLHLLGLGKRWCRLLWKWTPFGLVVSQHSSQHLHQLLHTCWLNEYLSKGRRKSWNRNMSGAKANPSSQTQGTRLQTLALQANKEAACSVPQLYP